jgi:ribosome-binding ATPase YchF (GTP1/OBG family)
VVIIKEKLVGAYSLITCKPIIYLVNLNAKDYKRKKNKYLMKIKTWIDEHGGAFVSAPANPLSALRARYPLGLPPFFFWGRGRKSD